MIHPRIRSLILHRFLYRLQVTNIGFFVAKQR